jgi:hypothetical protein
MDYFKRISQIVLIALPLSLLLAIGILFTQQMIKAKISHEHKESTNPLSLLSLFNFSDGQDIGGEKLYRLKNGPKSWGGKFEIKENLPVNQKRESKLSNDSNISDMLILFIIVFILLCIISFIFFKKKKKKIQSIFPIEESQKLSKTRKTNKKETNSNKQSLLPNEQISIMLIEWEKQLPKAQQRRSYETIQQWFERIGKNHEIVPFYEKVRYGKKQILNEEIELVRKVLNYS